MGTEKLKKDLHTRYLFAMASLILTFAYLYITNTKEIVVIQSMFAFLATVSVAFGVSKATEYLSKVDETKVVGHTRIKFAAVSLLCSFGYLFTVDSPNPQIEQAVFGFLGTVALGLGASKATEHYPR